MSPITVGLFGALVVYLFIMDLRLNRGREMTVARAASWSFIYIAFAIGFAGFLWGAQGPEPAKLFLTAYVLEKALSVDNLMVFGMVFAYFGVKPEYRHRVLHWGILGAAAMRLAFVWAGTTALDGFGPWAEGVFAAFIIYAAWKMLMSGGEPAPIDHETRWYSRALKHVWRLYTGADTGNRFFVPVILPVWAGRDQTLLRHSKTWCMTPLFLCLISIEMTDVMFAFDSVPTVIAVARDPFIVYSSMIFAIMGLRAMYFILDAMQRALRYVGPAVGMVLLFVAAKLCIHAVTGRVISPGRSLIIVGTILGLGVALSVLLPEKAHARREA